MTRSRFRLVAAFAVTAAAVVAPTARATTMSTPVSLSRMVHDASTIVSGTVTSVTTGRTGRTSHVEITVTVDRSIRGDARDTLTFRQVGLADPQGWGDGRLYVGGIAGLPTYREGENVLLFLGPESPVGLRTTVGLGQGKFVITSGNAQNDLANRGLFRDLSTQGALSEKEIAMLATTRGVASAETLVGLVQRAVEGNWWGAPGAPPKSRGLSDAISLDKPKKGGR